MCRSSTCCAEPVGRRARVAAARFALVLVAGASALAAAPRAGADDEAARRAGLAAARRIGEVGAGAERAVDEAAPAEAGRSKGGLDRDELGSAWPGYDPQVDLVSAVVKTIATLGAFIALAYLTVKVVGPRVGPLGGRPTDLIQVHALKRLDPKTTLYLVEVGGKYSLVSVSEHRVQALTQTELDADGLAERIGAERPGEAKLALPGGIGKALERGGARAFASLLRSAPAPSGKADGEAG